ncbi:tetratricopeptide repeat protein [Candidatus Ichthyocystis hellenicum]|uniref:tetratricopeptide repeat protein n=1 Tax=Candidatus Ichthyocystis hellenicum TaxID=1561003 RepID=UPI000B869280|nr:outer membrane protein assembly factor BamD [Candidatus Ichthyocystis hellenicum]
MNYKVLLFLFFVLLGRLVWADFGDLPYSSKMVELEDMVEHQKGEIVSLRARLDQVQLDMINNKQEQLVEHQKLVGQLSDLQQQILKLGSAHAVDRDKVVVSVPRVVAKPVSKVTVEPYTSPSSLTQQVAYEHKSSESSLDFRAYERALQSMRSGHYRGALVSFKEIKSKLSPNSPHNADLNYWMGTAYYLLGEYKNAIEFFSNVYEKWPESERAPDALFNLVNSYYQTDQKSAAKAVGENLIKGYPHSAAAKSLLKLAL